MVSQFELPAAPRFNYARMSIEMLIANPLLRLNTIYQIVDKNGNLVPFKMNAEQYDLYKNRHNLNIITKARQKGFTTLIQLFLLDTALFNANTSCGVIAHNQEDARKFFDKKIKLAYDMIPDDFRERFCPAAEQDRAGQLKFANGSYITVGTSMRSDTVQYLHISEFGKMCAKFPDKADEVVSGALNAVGPGNVVFIESTGEGAHGHFYDMAVTARKATERGDRLTAMDYKFFFYPWWQSPEYELHDYVQLESDDEKYFRELQRYHALDLPAPKKYWYAKKRREQRDRMFREYPSTPEEAFRGILDGAPFGSIMAGLRQQGRVRPVPWTPSVPVNTFWDLGHNDKTAIWFHQLVGHENRFIDYYEDRLLPLHHYAKVVQEKRYVYGEHYLPHDIEVTELTQRDSKTRREILEELGIKPTIVVPRIPSEQEGIDATRDVMESCFFDDEKCAQGVRCLENVRYRWDDKNQEFQPHLLRNWAKHGGDSFMQWGHGYRHRRMIQQPSEDTSELARSERATNRSSHGRRNHQFTENDWRL